MGFMDTMKDAMDTVRKIELSNPITLEELFDIIKDDAAILEAGKPELKKGLLGKSIAFPKTAKVTPRITVKNNVVTLKKETDTSSTSVGVGGMNFKVSGGSNMQTADEGSAYFKKVAAALEAVLAGK